MLISYLFSSPLYFFITFGGLVLAITIHEFTHAFTADKLGDPTPRLQGRVNLNPKSHLDPLGTLAILFAPFGWGKPVEFDPYNLQNIRRDSALIALAGPVSNILLAIFLSIVLHVVPLSALAAAILARIALMNISLAIFNFVPVHPLDGGKIISGFLPTETAVEFERFMQRYGLIVLIFLIFPFGNSTSPLNYLISPIISGIGQLLNLAPFLLR